MAGQAVIDVRVRHRGVVFVALAAAYHDVSPCLQSLRLYSAPHTSCVKRHVSNVMCHTMCDTMCAPHSSPARHLKPPMVSASEERASLKTARGKGAGGAAARENAKQKAQDKRRAQRQNAARERATTRPDTTRTVKGYINVERYTTSRDIQRQNSPL